MTREELRGLKQWFRDFVQGYRSEDADLRRNVELKVRHTMQVRREIRFLSESLSLNEKETCLSEAIALLHDAGRFEQYARHRTFADDESENHADLSLSILRKAGILDSLAPEDTDLIFRAISYHNRPTVPRDVTERQKFFANLLRDADKLDIWRVVIEYYQQEPGERNEAVAVGFVESPGISPAVATSLLKKEPVRGADLRNINDLKLFQISWVYDLNFTPTFCAVQERRYLQAIANTLPSAPEVETFLGLAFAHLGQRCSEKAVHQHPG
ncbi:MAG: HD domain-containing protein [Bacteroidetes bacterium]|nr:HD domain-containing protein [Bacteroidota bacterium]